MKTNLNSRSNFGLLMTWRRVLWLLMVLGVVSVFFGCASTTVHRQYRPGQSVISSNDTHRVAVIEFDDQGVFWERQQLEGAMSTISEIPKDKNVVLIAYVHGWKHNASQNSGNLRSFTNFVQTFAEVLNPEPEGQRTNIIVGVYLAWRGDILPEPAQTFGYWNRRNTARRVSGVSATEAILSLVGETRSKPSHRVVVVGHSMGALIVERAVTQVMVGSRLMNSDLVNRLVSIYGTTNSGGIVMTAEEARVASNKLASAIFRRDQAQDRLPELTNHLKTVLEAEKQTVVLRAGESNQWRRLVESCRESWRAVVTNHVSGTNFITLIAPDEIQATGAMSEAHERLRRLSDELKNRRWRQFVEDESRSIKGSYEPLIRSLSTAFTAEDKSYLTVLEIDRQLARIQTNLAGVKKSLDDTRNVGGEFAEQIPQLESALAVAQTNYIQALEMAGKIAGVVDRPPADLVLLVNPASEALVAQKTIDAFKNNPIFKRSASRIDNPNQPWIISVSSEKDRATRRIFPVAETLSALGLTCGEPVLMTNRFPFEHRSPFAPIQSDALSHYYCSRKLGGVSQRTLVTHTAPHTKILISHEIKKAARHSTITNMADLIGRNLSNPTWNEVVGSNYNFYVKPVPKQTPSSYWILKADKELLPNHNEFFTPDFYALAISLYRMSVDQRSEPKVVPAGQTIADATP